LAAAGDIPIVSAAVLAPGADYSNFLWQCTTLLKLTVDEAHPVEQTFVDHPPAIVGAHL
jgi:hypothetical protein